MFTVREKRTAAGKHEPKLRLTYDAERDEEAAYRLGRYLALVDAGVPLLGPLDLKRPVVDVFVMRRLEPLVGGVRVAADGEYVDVPVSDPRDLRVTVFLGVFLLEALQLRSRRSGNGAGRLRLDGLCLQMEGNGLLHIRREMLEPS
uniref:Uncharacterized protein n=1 Tax=Anopheles farauti TaxID=69004 RepID=A0A182R067_9DIPT